MLTQIRFEGTAGRRTGWVVGMNHGAHDSSCALLHNGELVACVEEERLSRTKRASEQSPADALAWCLEYADIRLDDVEYVALGSDHDILARWRGYDSEERAIRLPYDSREWLMPTAVFPSCDQPPIVHVQHHVAHAASSFWPSGFADAAVLVMDAQGEHSSTSLAIGNGYGIRILESHPIEDSLGYFYEAAAQYASLGNEAAGKLMGLASYGRPTEDVGLVSDGCHVRWPIAAESQNPRGEERIRAAVGSLVDYFERQCFPFDRGLGEEVMSYANFAASAQRALEEVELALVGRLRQITDSSSLVLAGGVALNCSANGRIAASGLFDRIWVQPMANDAGVGLGAAFILSHFLGYRPAEPFRMSHAYWGPEDTKEAVQAALTEAGMPFQHYRDAEFTRATAAELSRGRIVAWHQGRAEVGPRALGARSFLGDPRRRKTLVRLNQIKSREMWRPVAPSILRDRFEQFFAGHPSEFMLVASNVREEVKHLIPAVVHVDGSARPQIVDQETNPRYGALLRDFEDLTGVPVLVNTSLNVAGEPIATRARDTVKTFLESGADVLAIEGYLAVAPHIGERPS